MKSIYNILVFLLILPVVSFSQDFLMLGGQVTSTDTGLPVAGHEVYMVTEDSTGFFYTFITDEQGYYGDSILFNSFFIIVYTFDCEMVLHEVGIENPVSPVIVDFEICTIINDCNASYLAFPHPTNYLTYEFTDMSTGGDGLPPDAWFWDFGDGTSSTEQNPVHTFPDFGEYWVCLTIIDSVDNCQDELCFKIPVEEPPECMAYFSHYPVDSLNLMEMQFMDLSAGTGISEWYWDFGDSSFSVEQNPVHLFQDTGTYQVCLTITDMFGFCDDMYCEEVYIQNFNPVECVAAFTYSIDSNANEMNIFHFFDTSTGNPITWFWNFGDGSTSYEQNPVHIYEDSGTYEVCLTIQTSNNLQYCEDDTCMFVATPNYYNIGGFAFAGNFPINNPVHQNDTAIALLYRVQEEGLYPVDSLYFYEYGYFWFTQLIESHYVLKIQLTEGSQHYADLFPTYYGNQLLWENAVPFYLQNDTFNMDVSLQQSSGSDNGNGLITGSVMIGNLVRTDMASHEHMEILLLTSSDQPVKYTYSDTDGDFGFEGLPLGTYKLLAESAGLYSVAQVITLTEAMPEVSNVVLSVYENNVFGIDEPILSDVQIGDVFPNPFNNEIHFEIHSEEPQSLYVTVSNIFGQRLYNQLVNFSGNKELLKVETQHLSDGIYIITVSTSNGLNIRSQKIIK